MANPKSPLAPMDLYLERMVGDALRQAHEGFPERLELVSVERERPPLLPLPGWREVIARDEPSASSRTPVMTDQIRRLLGAYVSRRSGNA